MHASDRNRVLVVEDPHGRDMLTLGLEMAGYQVDVADDGEAGLIVAAARTPAAAIIDLGVPTGVHPFERERELSGGQRGDENPLHIGYATAPHRHRGNRSEKLMSDVDWPEACSVKTT